MEEDSKRGGAENLYAESSRTGREGWEVETRRTH